MTVRAAHHFIATLKQDEALRARAEPAVAAADLAALAVIAACTVDDLRAAHAQHWALCWIASAAAGNSPSSRRASAE